MTYLNMDGVIANSYKDFHAKGFDYICLSRTPDLTIKLYMFDGDVSKIPEVVNPHDHRYAFATTVLCGEMTNFRFAKIDRAIRLADSVYNTFEYRTPLNGGDGFKYVKQQALRKSGEQRLTKGESYRSNHSDLHTIRIHGNETAILLAQGKDVVPLDVPTMTYTNVGRKAPNLDGLYSRFRPDEIRDRLNKLERISGQKIYISD